MRETYIQILIGLINRSELDAVLICPSEELNFFLGFSPLMCERFQGLFIKKDGGMFYFCNLITGDEMRKATSWKIPVHTWFDNEIMIDVLSETFKKENLIRPVIAVNSSAQAFNIVDIAEKVGATFKNGVALLEETRICKTEPELIALRKAAAIADEGFINTLPQIRAGMKEQQIHDILVNQMKQLGGSDPGALVASGPNAGFPHYHGNERIVEKGDCLILDFGCLYSDMHSDMTRTIFFEPVTEEIKSLYHLLYKAQQTAESSVFEDAFIPDIDAAARRVLAEKGLELTCTTRIGHGIGYMTHEAPYINAYNSIHIKRGMCFSIEPGIYIPGKLGIRIEDIVAVNLEGQTEILNKATKDFITIGKNGISFTNPIELV